MRRIGRVLRLLVLPLVGLLLGLYWKDFSALIRPLTSGLSAAWKNGETFLSSHPAEAGLAFAIIGSIVVPAWSWLRNLLIWLIRRRSIIELIFQDEDRVYLVTSHMKQTSFQRIGTNQVINLPSNAPFLPSNIAISTALINNYARDRYGDRKTAVLHFDNDNWGANAHNFISIGGPFVNEIAKRIIDANSIPEFQITNIPTAVDQTDTYEAERESRSTNPDAPLATDYGFAIHTKNPFNPEKRIVIVFGLWPQGTQAAVAAVLDPAAPSSRNFKMFYKAVKRGRSVIGIVQVRIRGLILERGELIKVREFSVR
jgi:hypothetical protein